MPKEFTILSISICLYLYLKVLYDFISYDKKGYSVNKKIKKKIHVQSVTKSCDYRQVLIHMILFSFLLCGFYTSSLNPSTRNHISYYLSISCVSQFTSFYISEWVRVWLSFPQRLGSGHPSFASICCFWEAVILPLLFISPSNVILWEYFCQFPSNHFSYLLPLPSD